MLHFAPRKIVICQKNRSHSFAIFYKPDNLFTPIKVTTQGNETPSTLGSAILGSLALDLGLALALVPILPSIKELLKQFMQIYMKTV